MKLWGLMSPTTLLKLQFSCYLYVGVELYYEIEFQLIGQSRDGGDIGLFITLVQKLLLTRFLFVCFGDLSEF